MHCLQRQDVSHHSIISLSFKEELKDILGWNRYIFLWLSGEHMQIQPQLYWA